MRLKPSEGRFSVRDYSGTYSPAEPKWSHFRQTKWPGEKRDAVTASCSLSLPIVPLRENSVPVQKDCRVEVPIMWWRPSAAAAPENEETPTFSTADSSKSRQQDSPPDCRTAAAETPWRLHRGLNWPHPIQLKRRSLLFLSAQQLQHLKTPIRFREHRIPVLNRYTGSIKPCKQSRAQCQRLSGENRYEPTSNASNHVMFPTTAVLVRL